MAEGRIDLNRADQDQLAALPGMDRELASRIVGHRRRSGPFRSLDELILLGPLPPDAEEALRKQGYVEGDPAAAERARSGGAFSASYQAWHDGGRIPERYTREGENVSPGLAWRDAPPQTKSFALIMDDPDAPGGTFGHWGLFDIAAERDRLPEGTTGGAPTERFGYAYNDFGEPRYDGPQPPEGHGSHRYRLRLAALDVEHLALPERPTVADLRDAMQEHAIAEAEVTGIYER